MSLKNYSDAFAGCSTTVLGLNRVADIVAATTAPAAAGGASQSGVISKVSRFVPGVAGAGVGAYFWKKHRVLGALAGHAVVNSGYDYYKGDQKQALCQLAVEGAGVLGALYHKRIPGLKSHPVVGWLGGALAGAVATYFVPGSPVRGAVARYR